MNKEEVIQSINTILSAARQAKLSAEEHESINRCAVMLAVQIGLPMNGAVVSQKEEPTETITESPKTNKKEKKNEKH